MRIEVMMTLPRESASVPMARHAVSTALETTGVSAECVHDVGVALSEACVHVCRHARPDEAYDVAVELADRQLTIDVHTTAAGGYGPLPEKREVMAHVVPEEGPGMALMRALADQALFDATTGGHDWVHLVKHLRWTDADATEQARPGSLSPT
jgi:serine/threonine-protein kinase RsbW